eukprot:1316948-Pyramimonas_sp.AAC.1
MKSKWRRAPAAMDMPMKTRHGGERLGGEVRLWILQTRPHGVVGVGLVVDIHGQRILQQSLHVLLPKHGVPQLVAGRPLLGAALLLGVAAGNASDALLLRQNATTTNTTSYYLPR